MKKVVIIADAGFQDEELIFPRYRLLEEGFQVEVATKNGTEIKGKYGIPIKPTMMTFELKADDFDAVFIPGGWECPEKVRQDKSVLAFLQEMNAKKKVIAAICHGPWVLASAKICKDRRMTCYVGMKDDLENAGATFVNEGVVVDDNIVTSPHYRNNPEFMRETIKLIKEKPADYSDVVVQKPWGYEFLVAQTRQVGLWYLNVKQGEQTSLHSHPNKKTGLVVLGGDAQVHFINGSHHLTPGKKIMIRNGVFHSTKNIGTMPLHLLEVETPNDKADIIRLEDNYGRSGAPYEGSEHHQPKKEEWNLKDGHHVGECHLVEKTFHAKEELIGLGACQIVILSGKLKSGNHDVLTPGDVVDNGVLGRLANKFEPVLPITAIIVTEVGPCKKSN